MKSIALGFLLSLFIIGGQVTAMPLDGSLPDGQGSNVFQVSKRKLNCSGLCSDQLARCTKAADVCSRQMCTEEDFAVQAAAFAQCFSNYDSCLPGCTKASVKPKL